MIHQLNYSNQVIREDMERILKSERVDWNRFAHKHILITGSSGMIGSYLVFALCHASIAMGLDITVTASARSPEKALDRFRDLLEIAPNILDIRQIDVTHPIDDEIHPADFVINAASPASTELYSSKPADVLIANIQGARNTLDFAVSSHSERYLFISSGEVYGTLDKELISENDYGIVDQLSVRGCYSEGKRAAEALCASYWRQFGLETVMVRPSHTYGPTMDLENDHRVFAEFVRDCMNGRDIVLKGSGTDFRTFCYLADACIAYFAVLLDGSPGQAYNVTSPNGYISIGDLADLVSKLALEGNCKVVSGSHSEAYQLGSQQKGYRSSLSAQKLKDLGFECNTSVQEGFERTVRGFRLQNESEV